MALSTTLGPAGPIIVAIGIFIQITATILATIFTHDDYQVWINHCYWGDSAKKGKNVLPEFTDTPLNKWQNNLGIQLEAYNFFIYGFKTEFKVWKERSSSGIMGMSFYEPCAAFQVSILPNCILEESKVYLSVKLRKPDGSQKIIIENKIIALNDNMLSENEKKVPDFARKTIIEGKGYIFADIKWRDKRRIEKIQLVWLDPQYLDKIGYKNFWFDNDLQPYHTTHISGLRPWLEEPLGYLEVEIYIDLFGNGQLIVPGKDKNNNPKKKKIKDHLREYFKNE